MEVRWCSECDGLIWKGRSVSSAQIYGQDKERQYLQRISEYNSSGIRTIRTIRMPRKARKARKAIGAIGARCAVHNLLRLEESALKLQEQIDAVQQTTETTETTETCELNDGQGLEKAVRDLPSTKIIPCSK